MGFTPNLFGHGMPIYHGTRFENKPFDHSQTVSHMAREGEDNMYGDYYGDYNGDYDEYEYDSDYYDDNYDEYSDYGEYSDYSDYEPYAHPDKNTISNPYGAGSKLGPDGLPVPPSAPSMETSATGGYHGGLYQNAAKHPLHSPWRVKMRRCRLKNG